MHRLFASSDQFASARYRSGAEIFGEGDPSDHIYQVVSGAVRTHKLLSNDRRQIGAFYLPGDLFGLEDAATHRFTAQAITSTTVHLAKRECLNDVVNSNPSVFRVILAETNRNLMHVENHLLLLGRQNSLERVAAFLLDMRLRSTEADVIHLPMTRRDIADYLGLALETVSRAFADLRSRKILGLDASRPRKVVVLHAKALADLADYHPPAS
jgi:CRP/FNR family nitrogen fixation transcriptional regulator